MFELRIFCMKMYENNTDKFQVCLASVLGRLSFEFCWYKDDNCASRLHFPCNFDWVLINVKTHWKLMVVNIVFLSVKIYVDKKVLIPIFSGPNHMIFDGRKRWNVKLKELWCFSKKVFHITHFKIITISVNFDNLTVAPGLWIFCFLLNYIKGARYSGRLINN